MVMNFFLKRKQQVGFPIRLSILTEAFNFALETTWGKMHVPGTRVS